MNYIDDSDYEEVEIEFESGSEDEESVDCHDQPTDFYVSSSSMISTAATGPIDVIHCDDKRRSIDNDVEQKKVDSPTDTAQQQQQQQQQQRTYQIQSYNKILVQSRFIISTDQDILNSKIEDLEEKLTSAVENLQHCEKLQLLIKYEWDISKKKTNDIFNQDDKFFSEAGISTQNRGVFYTESDEFTCHICCETQPHTPVYKLEMCGHTYCIQCYKQYLKTSSTYDIQHCMGHCPTIIPFTDFKEIVGDDYFDKFCLFSIRSHINKKIDLYKACPSTNCKDIVVLLDPIENYKALYIPPVVHCTSSHIFCFVCNKEDHSPCDCTISQEWIKKTSKESKALNWVLANTKECPKCSVNIEKNGGCNHMICQNCEYQFCWVCDQNWESHKGSNFNCVVFRNNVAPDGSKKTKNVKIKEDYKYSFQRFRHFYRMFSDCEQSSALDLTLYSKIDKRIMKLQKNVGISWIEGQFLDNCMKEMIDARKVLKWSFVLIYYSDPSQNFTKMFENNQIHLMSSIDKLAELFAMTDPEEVILKKSDYLNLSAFIKTRKRAVIEAGRDLIKLKVAKC